MEQKKTLVVALGGNSILRPGGKGTFDEQYATLQRTCENLLEILTGEYRVVITHGNGPQVGNLLLAIEAVKKTVAPMPMDICGAATEGWMGYMIQQTLANCLRSAGRKHNVTTVVTQVIVDKNDPAFSRPTKPVGPFYDLAEAERLRSERGWAMFEDSRRGYRRVVPSPKPINVQEARIIKALLDGGDIVIAVGGGGIPVVRQPDRSLVGVEAVIDKDYASSCLAIEIDADALLILTAVEKVFHDFGLPSQKALDHLTVAEAKKLLAEGQFGIGSMEPKIGAAIEFIEDRPEPATDRERWTLITLPEALSKALHDGAGTWISANKPLNTGLLAGFKH